MPVIRAGSWGVDPGLDSVSLMEGSEVMVKWLKVFGGQNRSQNCIVSEQCQIREQGLSRAGLVEGSEQAGVYLYAGAKGVMLFQSDLSCSDEGGWTSGGKLMRMIAAVGDDLEGAALGDLGPAGDRLDGE